MQRPTQRAEPPASHRVTGLLNLPIPFSAPFCVFASCFLLISLLPATRPVCGQIEIREVIWGFDGRVRPERFNPLSIQIDNPSADPFEGTLHLVKSVGGKIVGAPLEQETFVSPFARKWVQFYPFVKDDQETWTLQWDDGRERYELPGPPFPTSSEAKFPTTVLLSDSQDLTQRGGAVKRFPDLLFPPVVTATDGLDVVLLDYVPRWTEARRQGFLDWLARGGTVHLLFDADGQFPRFPQSLAVLNTPADRFHVGAGIVFRQRRTRGEVTRDFIEEAVPRETASSIRRPKSELDELDEVLSRVDFYGPGDQPWIDDFAAGVFHDLRSQTLPRHNWLLIYLLSITYVFLIFPGAYLLGRRRLDYPIVYGVLLGMIGLFSVALGLIGRRGHDEETAVHTVAVARSLPDEQWDVTGWSNAFVTQGALYRIANRGTGGLYSTGLDVERINGVIRSGQRGELQVDIPPFSSRTFAYRVKTKKPGLKFRIEAWETERDALKTFIVSVSGTPLDQRLVHAYALYRDQIYPLQAEEGHLSLQSGGRSLGGFLSVLNDKRFWHYVYPNVWGEERPIRDDLHERLAVPLIAWSLGLKSRREAEQLLLPPDRVRLFVYAPLPDEFLVQNDHLHPQTGSVLYCVDLIQPGLGN